jgi:threonylcarbamoyladenosine tRNA methylthiotransferase MtaB
VGGDVRVVTFGCRLNAYESEQVRDRAAADGVVDAVVFNTCAVTGEAVRQARQAIRKARRERPDARLIVTGCAAQIDPAAFAAMPEVDLVVGNAEKTAPWGLMGAGVRVGDIFAPAPPLTEPLPVAGERDTDGSAAASASHRDPALSVALSHGRGRGEVRALAPGLAERARAYVEVQNGCDHRCTFCIIPFGRGNSRSVTAERVVGQVRRLAASGYNEVVLTGVDLTSWGADIEGGLTLGQLVARILTQVPELPRLRLSSIDAAEIDDDLMACLADQPRLMPHLHLSLQSGDDLILKRMKRRHLRADAIALIEAVRRVRPETAFGADFIAGFPTETEAAFANTLSLVEEVGLSFLHVFPYSPRPGTPAARMPAVAGAVVKQRAARLRAAGDAALARHLDRQVGRRITALVERPGLARAEDFTEIAFAGEAAAGSLIVGRISGHDGRRAMLEVGA